ncbi:AraC family transcriptional regulator [Anaerosporobacter faecicola]|uniref:AraC family transcriptional regulator n=1 Tax=Anaerosporobacter faecicola TaxID=2718714 RepID=UPI0014397BBE|nr:AraC family transcriptional regulator [Anaerosporobacter faecicola]
MASDKKVYKKTGYLDQECRIFYLTDHAKKQIEYHYHDFYKVLIFLRGNVTYHIEGKQYSLKTGDTVLVKAGEIHHPLIYDDIPYERIIAYVSPDFMKMYSSQDSNLFLCFDEIRKQDSNLIRLPNYHASQLALIVQELAQICDKKEYASELYQKMKFMEYMIVLNRLILSKHVDYAPAITANQTVLEILRYINENITKEISVDRIADKVFLNRSYIMHLFKAETGYTIGKYITEKRLFLARQYIAEGMTIHEACYKSGFLNYNTFYHAYRKRYHVSPKKQSEQTDHMD